MLVAHEIETCRLAIINLDITELGIWCPKVETCNEPSGISSSSVAVAWLQLAVPQFVSLVFLYCIVLYYTIRYCILQTQYTLIPFRKHLHLLPDFLLYLPLTMAAQPSWLSILNCSFEIEKGEDSLVCSQSDVVSKPHANNDHSLRGTVRVRTY